MHLIIFNKIFIKKIYSTECLRYYLFYLSMSSYFSVKRLLISNQLIKLSQVKRN